MLPRIALFARTRLPSYAIAAALVYALAYGFGLGGTLDDKVHTRVLVFVGALCLASDRGTRRLLQHLLSCSKRTIWCVAGVLLLWGAIPLISQGKIVIHACVALVIIVLSRTIRRTLVRSARESRDLASESVRWLVLAGVCAYLISPYVHRGLVGGGDAHHYVQQVTDITRQIHGGVFPVFVGQSPYAFNGDIHPLRTAPYFSYLSAAINLVTFGRLGPAGVQNLLIAVSFLAAAALMYALLTRLWPQRRWTAFVLTLLFASSPGVLALAYSGDMIASWMTLPWLCVLFHGVIKLTRTSSPEASNLVQIAAALAMVWLAHPPIAFWTTLVVSGSLVVWAWGARSWQRWNLVAATGALCALLSAYVFVSVYTLDLPVDPNLISIVRGPAMLDLLRQGWEGFLRPIDPSGANLLHNLQLSPGLWLAALVGLVAVWKGGSHARVFTAFILAVLALIVPLEGIAGRLWNVVPAFVINTTEKWPVQRFYPILSVLVPFLGASGLALVSTKFARAHRVLVVLLAIAAIYSVIDARKLVYRGRGVQTPVAFTEQRLRPENAVWSRYSYEMYGRVPRYFSHGSMSPMMQTRLLAPESLEVVRTNLDAFLNPSGGGTRSTTHRFVPTEYGGRFEPKLKLEPGQSYVSRLKGGDVDLNGTLQLHGSAVYREYLLPSSGEPYSFGLGPRNKSAFPLYTTAPTGDEVEVRFYQAPGTAPKSALSEIELISVDEKRLPFQLMQTKPLVLRVALEQEGWLETPKLYIPGYQARINGEPAPLARSPDGLVMVPVSRGFHEVELAYPGTPLLRLAFWLTAVAWLGVVCFIAWPVRSLSRPAVIVIVGRTATWAAAAAGCVAILVAALPRPTVPTKLDSANALLDLQLPVDHIGARETITHFDLGAHSYGLILEYTDGQQMRVGLQDAGGHTWLGSPIRVNYLLTQRLELRSWLDIKGTDENAGTRSDVSASSLVVKVMINHQLALLARPQLPVGQKADNEPGVSPRFSGHLRDWELLAQDELSEKEHPFSRPASVWTAVSR